MATPEQETQSFISAPWFCTDCGAVWQDDEVYESECPDCGLKVETDPEWVDMGVDLQEVQRIIGKGKHLET